MGNVRQPPLMRRHSVPSIHLKAVRFLARSKESFDRFWGAGEDDVVTFLDERTLDEIWIFDEDIQQFVIGELGLGEIKLLIDVFFFADDV